MAPSWTFHERRATVEGNEERTIGTEMRRPLLPSWTYFADGADMAEVEEVVELMMLSVGTMWPPLRSPIYTVKYPAARFRSVIVGSVHFDIP